MHAKNWRHLLHGTLVLVMHLVQRPDNRNVNRGGAPPVSPEWIGILSTFLVGLKCRQITSHAKTNSKWWHTDRMQLAAHDTNEISANFQRKPHLRSKNTVGLVRTLSYVRVSNISKMAACNRKWIWNTYISACIHVSNEIPTSMFLMLRNTTGLI